MFCLADAFQTSEICCESVWVPALYPVKLPFRSSIISCLSKRGWRYRYHVRQRWRTACVHVEAFVLGINLCRGDAVAATECFLMRLEPPSLCKHQHQQVWTQIDSKQSTRTIQGPFLWCFTTIWWSFKLKLFSFFTQILIVRSSVTKIYKWSKSITIYFEW